MKHLDNNWNNPDNWKWGVFYYNKNDDRLFVPKRIPELGVTINFAHPYSRLTSLIIFLFIIGTIVLIETNKNG